MYDVFCITFQEKSTQSRYLGIWKLKNGRAYEDDSRNGGLGHHCHGDGASYGNECRLIATVPAIPHGWLSSWPEPQNGLDEGAVDLLHKHTATFAQASEL